MSLYAAQNVVSSLKSSRRERLYLAFIAVCGSGLYSPQKAILQVITIFCWTTETVD